MKDNLPDISGINTDLEDTTRGQQIWKEIDELISKAETERKAKQKRKISTRKSKACIALNDALYQHALKSSRLGRDKPHAIPMPKHHENSAGHVEKCIVAYISLVPRSFAVKIGGKGTPRKDKNGDDIMANTGDTNGVSDIIAWIDGRTLCIEVKFSKRDKQSKAQVKFENNIKRCGGTYIIVKNFTDFLPKFKAWYEGGQLNLFQ